MFCRIHIFVLCAAIVFSLSAPVHADERPFGKGSRTRGLTGGWGHSWRPLFGKTRSQITFVAFAPRMGWFVTDRLELYGEGTLFLRIPVERERPFRSNVNTDSGHGEHGFR